MVNTVNYEQLIIELWAYKDTKENKAEYLLEDNSWMVHEAQYVKNLLVPGLPLKAKVEVKTRSSKPVIKEYEIPF